MQLAFSRNLPLGEVIANLAQAVQTFTEEVAPQKVRYLLLSADLENALLLQMQRAPVIEIEATPLSSEANRFAHYENYLPYRMQIAGVALLPSDLINLLPSADDWEEEETEETKRLLEEHWIIELL